MTVQTTTLRSDANGNGTATTFTIPFYFLDNTHIKVLRTQISTGIVTTLALTTDYTVTGAGVSTGGTLTCVVAPTTDQRLSILRNVPYTQLTHYVENDPFPAASHEAALDQLTMETQQLAELATRAVTIPANYGTVGNSLPAPEAGKVLAWNQYGTGFQNLDASTLATITAYGTWLYDLLNGDGVTTVFALSGTPGVLANLHVSISGVAQRPGVDFTVSGTTLTFLSAPPSGTQNILCRYGSTLVTSTTVPVDGSVTPAKMANIGYELGNRNRIINGGMTVSQRYGTTAVTNINSFVDQCVLDRWNAQASAASKFTSRQSDYAQGDIAPPPGFSKYLRVESLGNNTPIATDYFVYYQSIEGINWADLNWGTAGAAPVTVSFWAYATTAGTYSGAITNSTGTRSYPFSFALAAATWTKVTVTVPGDTSGVWPSYNNAQNLTATGVLVRFDLGSGSNYLGTANVWASANYNGATGSTSVLQTGRKLYLTGVQVERGSTATPFEFRTYQQELAHCQRYCYVVNSAGVTDAALGCGQVYSLTQALVYMQFPVPMRASPSATLTAVTDFYVTQSSGANAVGFTSATVIKISPSGAELSIGGIPSGVTAGAATMLRSNTVNARIYFSAELW